MGDARSSSMARSSGKNLVAVDPYDLVQAILGSRAQSHKSPTESDRTETLDYDDLTDFRTDMLVPSGDDDDPASQPQPDEQPKNVRVGAANPYALVEAIIGRRIDRTSVNAANLISQVLQTDYDELFDMRNRSVLYAGLKLNETERRAEQLSEKDIRLLRERDLITPDLSRVQRLSDLEQIGLKDLGQTRVKHARIQNGKIRLVIQANNNDDDDNNNNRLARQVSNRELTPTLNELMTPFRLRHRNGDGGDDNDDDDPNKGDGGGNENRRKWSPPNASWRDMYDYNFQSVNRRLINDVTNFHIGDGRRVTKHNFDDPEQGASTNSWLIAAIFSVFWAEPSRINRATRIHRSNDDDDDDDDDDNNDNNNGRTRRRRQQHRLRVRLHDKGGNNNNRTETIEVNYEVPITNSNNEPVYCRASDRTDIWPSLYEKAFAQWISNNNDNNNNNKNKNKNKSKNKNRDDKNNNNNNNQDRPDITVTHSGDPIKAMAQLNGRDPVYYRCDKHPTAALLGIVRAHCVNNRTINPMACFTHATSGLQREGRPGTSTYNWYRGSTLVANHAYSICGYAVVGDRQYIVLRNPWGVTEPAGLTSYPGVLTRMDPEVWRPAEMLDQGGLFAMETEAFQEAFQYMGVAK